MSQKTVSRDNTSELLLKAAKRLFARQGYDGTSVKQLADEAGVNISLVSYHFGGKKELYRQCLDQFGRIRLAVTERILQTVETREEFEIRLRLFVEEFIEFHLDEPDLTKIVHRECEQGHQESIVQDIFESTFLKVFERLVGFFVAAQKKGIVRVEVSPLRLASMLFASMTHAIRMDELGKRYFKVTIKDPRYRRETIDQMLRLFLGGALKAPRSAK